ncbi:GntR family transcriptional regulator [Bacillus gaemokensis]|uniref:GntR family transcriptional regulator n=1 Tax=Bacillus gaemokensis TaxID=574375 RepID=A0A073K8Z5_9BACI|nr:GntR family transcriptional regulator [Bacillus gaemokensis]KEK23025.1 GntR family transcriptional regulator [Bacillus gaemokensis]KYG37697.1 GntR family transcriptional regulator [Bacillus gaemokensis]
MSVAVNVTRKKGPLYLQIKNILRDRILHGVYAIHTNIPSEPQLEEEFKVSKITVRNAIKELVQEGYLEKKSGKGTKVIRNTSTAKLSKGKRFTEVLVEEGHKVQKKLLQAGVVDNEEGTVPFRLFGKQCFRIERLYVLNDAPYIHYTHYLPVQMEVAELSDLTFQSLYGLVEEQGVHLENFRDEFAVATPPAHIGTILGEKENTSLLKRMRYSYDEIGTVIEYSEGYYNTEMQHYVVNYDV